MGTYLDDLQGGHQQAKAVSNQVTRGVAGRGDREGLGAGDDQAHQSDPAPDVLPPRDVLPCGDVNQRSEKG